MPEYLTRLSGPIEDRVLNGSVSIVETGCRVWLRSKTPNGYGKLGVVGRFLLAHRAHWESVRGAIPGGLQLDHLCRNRSCVNLDHLELVTGQENCRRGFLARISSGTQSRMTHCKNGHEFTTDNTCLTTSGARRCRICRREYNRMAQRRHRATVRPDHA